jgi:hypothetical protein
MKIKIPHLGYTLIVKQPDGSQKWKAWVTHDSTNQCTLYIKQPIIRSEDPTLAHELVHVLQYISADRNLDLTYELEHAGYLMGYLMNEILGYEYDI